MADKHEAALVIADSWQQLFQLHQSLAELNRINAHSQRFLEQRDLLPQTPGAANPARIDPETWRKRAGEARALADITAHAGTKRSLEEIADSYEALASFQEGVKYGRAFQGIEPVSACGRQDHAPESPVQ